MQQLSEIYNRTREVLEKINTISEYDFEIEAISSRKKKIQEILFLDACPFRVGQLLESSQKNRARIVEILPYGHAPFYRLKLHRERKDRSMGIIFFPYSWERWKLINNGVITSRKKS